MFSIAVYFVVMASIGVLGNTYNFGKIDHTWKPLTGGEVTLSWVWSLVSLGLAIYLLINLS